MYDVLIVEDDFYVANLHEKYVEQHENFRVVFSARTKADVLTYLATHQAPQLILLDRYIPDVEGFDLLWQLRTTYPSIDIMMITAAKDSDVIQQALHAGVVDYLIKPVELTRFNASLTRFVARKEMLKQGQLGQQTIDILLGITHDTKTQHYPKGIDASTLHKIEAALRTTEQGLTAVSLATQLGISRSTARRYLEYLVSVNRLVAELQYGDVGRPERHYKKP
ncbi:MAG TPA: response regulator [Metalysinibacillus jejuensis]|uniref:Transcriptional regulatory protein n=1 Tax=Metalysinibacillus jejuensis TaxID=914327 RepID=A0A921NBE2_9BACL|nr:response regulator [Metalysinibacillus jejuensis]